MTIALELKEDGMFDITIENGRIKTEDSLTSEIKHLIFCHGRIDTGNNPANRFKAGGYIGQLYTNETLFSTAWQHYTAKNITNNTTINAKNALLVAINASPRIAAFRAAEGTVELLVELMQKNTLQFQIKLNNITTKFTIS